MGAAEVLNLLKRNIGTPLDKQTIAEMTGVNIRTAHSILEKLKVRGEVSFKEVSSLKGLPKKYYMYVENDTYFEETYKLLTSIKQDRRFFDYRPDLIVNMMIVSELKKMNEAINDGSTK
jgi:predicted ArsR family transcriptional regulator